MAAGQNDIRIRNEIDDLLRIVRELAVGVERRKRNRIEHFLGGLRKGRVSLRHRLDMVRG